MASGQQREPARGKGRGGRGEGRRGEGAEQEQVGVGEKGVGRERDQGDAAGAESSEAAVDTSRRIGPWHPPDFQRQKVLADRLSNPALRASRPGATTSSDASSYSQQHQQQQEASEQQPRRRQTPSPSYLHYSPYYHHSSNRRAATADAPQNVRMNNNRSNNNSAGGNNNNNNRPSSSGNPSSPRHHHPSSPRRPQTSSSTTLTYQQRQQQQQRQPPLFPTPATTRKVTEDELDVIVERVTKPTVASRGGVDLRDKDFTYIPTPRRKTLPVVPGLERRYLGLQKVDAARLERIVERLTRTTSASKSKFAPNGNVYVDREPGAHLVTTRSARC